MNRKIISLILALMLAVTSAFALSGCGSDKEVPDNQPKTEEAAENDTEEEEPAEKNESSEEAITNEAQANTDSVKKTPKKTSSSKKTEGSSSNKNSGSSQNNSGESSSGSESEAAQVNVTVSVDGAFIGRSITVQSGASVFDALKKTGISVRSKNSIYGVYVYSINGLSEGDKGPGSGWTYKVNGTMPSKSADKYVVREGDSISWEYVS